MRSWWMCPMDWEFLEIYIFYLLQDDSLSLSTVFTYILYLSSVYMNGVQFMVLTSQFTQFPSVTPSQTPAPCVKSPRLSWLKLAVLKYQKSWTMWIEPPKIVILTYFNQDIMDIDRFPSTNGKNEVRMHWVFGVPMFKQIQMLPQRASYQLSCNPFQLKCIGINLSYQPLCQPWQHRRKGMEKAKSMTTGGSSPILSIGRSPSLSFLDINP